MAGAGITLVALWIVVTISEWTGMQGLAGLSAALTFVVLGLFALRISFARLSFILVGLALVFASWLTQPDWIERILAAFGSAAFIGAFLTALTALRNAAETSASIRECGRFLARQRPGRRYLALTLGGHAFALVLSYGSLVLLGHIVGDNARREEDPYVRFHRTRRMLLAIQRGFISTLTWSPLALGMAITTKIIPGATWSGAVPAALVSAVILAGTGWALDTLFKPRPRGVATTWTAPDSGWSTVLPLLGLLAVLVVSLYAVHLTTGMRAVSSILVAVPVIAMIWIVLQGLSNGNVRGSFDRHVRKFVTSDLPGFRSEFVLIMMAGFIGTLGAGLLRPILSTAGMDLSAVPGWVILVGLVWTIPLLGQIGMNPIMSVSILAPLLPTPAAMGVSPNDMVVAITSGWAITGASSPFTATTAFIGAIGKVSATRVGLVWNGPYILISAILLSVWVYFLV